MPAYDAVLFDSDGVLVTPPARETQLAATRTAFEAVGESDPAAEHVAAVADGLTGEQLREICDAYDFDPEAFWDAREHHDERSQFDRFRDGTRRLYDDVAAIRDLSHDCGVVSNNHHSTIEFVLSHFGLEASFDTYYGREKSIESLDLKKPDPHYLERALADLDADTALFVGDSESDVVAAERAGLDSAFVRRSHCADVALSTSPTFEVDDLGDVASLVNG
ncbi:HAD family hydrolase [Halomicrobium salinisoli]|uniref:HAD family hydrolase n=1 Tax=Halomicrobium salinisoli TaxID=2878391 RepID=UPI001CF0AAB4|nr:HAD-IA family hydrolase [Halomicrobium salinisoli]